VGEVRVALKLIAQLRALEPGARFALTTTTSTGYAVAMSAADTSTEVMYNAIDFWPVIRSAFRTIQPKRLVLVEAEVWPNLVAIASKHRVPIALVNARLSRRSEARFRRFVRLVAPIFHRLEIVCVPERSDVERWARLGVSPDRIHCVGSIKFDVQPSSAEHAIAAPSLPKNRPVLFGGSTHAGEEEILAIAFQRLRAEFPQLLLVIAPRHVERTAEIRARLEAQGLDVAVRSDAAERPRDCLLIDTTGELQSWYAIATVVFVGKSLTARGGQNPVEPIVVGKPVLFGPHMENFQPLADSLVERGGAIRVTDLESLTSEAALLFRDSNRAATLVANARAVLASHAGATRRTAELIVALKSARD
jgi:3-deoxy-D-manno-octulosonic-acid transferase